MTFTEAVHFDRFSISNAVAVKSLLQCGCEPYEDVYTYRRWKAQGFQVVKGEKAIRIPQVRTVDREDPDTGEISQRRLFHTAAVFCRHQVKK
jgi:hypothetical protein|tara:strand:- start:402 stop:677 length:276 start_codon:yes stop_codon:yes gene_type:complete